MSNYYVRKTGSDLAAGTSPATAWATIGKALGASGITSGDTVYIGAGTYREAVTIAMTSATVNTNVIGDITGQFTGDAGEIVWTAYTTNDTTAPSANATINLAGRDFLTFQYITFIGGGGTNGSCVDAATTLTSVNIVFRDCVFQSGKAVQLVTIKNSATGAMNWTFDRCVFYPAYWTAVYVLLSLVSGADYDVNIVFQNCIIHNTDIGIYLDTYNAGSFKPGGIDLFGCTVGSMTSAIYPATTGYSTSIPCTVYGCVIFGGYGALKATTSGQITENYNILSGNVPRTNVTAGANSSSDYSKALAMHIGQDHLIGRDAMPFLTPMASSGVNGFANGTNVPSVDFLNRARPSGAASTTKTVGAIERHDTWVKETGTVRTGSNAISCTGPGDHDFQLPVDASSTTVTVYMRYDTNHAATNKPQMQVLNGGECGVSDATATMTAAVDTWEQLSLNFTPTSKGVVTIRLISRSAAGNGKCFADDFNVS